jgi:hypothetical protein
MLDFIKGLFKKKEKFTDEDYEKHYEAKSEALEKILGKMHELVGHAIIPFQVGGAVDMYYYPNVIDGTAFVTMELIEPDGSGPKPNRMGTYELIAFTKEKIEAENEETSKFHKIERRICGFFTSIGNYSFQVKLEPGETCEIPGDEGEENNCLVFDEYKKDEIDFEINGRKHGLLLVIEIYRSEMEYAMKNGSNELFKKLKEKGYYPYSDLERDPVT